MVHDDTDLTNSLATTLGPDVAWFTDPVKALAALKAAKTIGFLITRLQFVDRQQVGLSLARLARVARPDVRIIFTGRQEHMEYTLGLGEFVPEPVEAAHIGMMIEWLS